jgi:protein-disulfide isomerase
MVAGVIVMACLAPRLGAAPQNPGPTTGETSQVVAEVNGQPITAAEIEQAVGQQITRLEEQIYTLRRQRLDNLIADRLLASEAAKRKITVSALVDAEVNAKVAVVTEAEVDSFVQANKARLKGEGEELRERVRAQLQRQKAALQRQAFVDSLRASASVVVRLARPPVWRAPVSLEGARAHGPAAAPVTLVEFSDYHCPFCKRVEDTIAQVLSHYGDKVKLVFKDFPIDELHPQARKAHEAARCAGEQGKFWEYHKRLFEGPAQIGEDLKTTARSAGLDMAPFEKCVASGKSQSAVQKEIDEGHKLGVTGTPGFFINGRFLSGAQPLEAFVRVIDDELARISDETSGSR